MNDLWSVWTWTWTLTDERFREMRLEEGVKAVLHHSWRRSGRPRLAQWRAVSALTGGMTLSDYLLWKTTTVERLPRKPAPDVHQDRAVIVGMVVFVGAVMVVCHIAHEVQQRTYWLRRHDERTLSASGVAAWLQAWEAARLNTSSHASSGAH
ncbi:hypothetical protein E2562_022892 [Oryza meyeriana var. granulata]|uniref:Uncharacterized protein n=1 Tax=Oryza meyeriana var. granulata TaxID=110450 RepID=A0A6G1D7C3_9ORYZ|nr:hypothetical protein E2562_022892 [Oryza meyeriana var. granulata]